MREITAKEVKRELKKIAFFVQFSGLFEQFSPQTRNVFESLPVEWEDVQFDGETHLKWKNDPSWKYADLIGKFNDKPIKININKSSSRNIYTIIYDNKKYKVENMGSLKRTFDSLAEGKTPKPQLMQMAYNVLTQKKSTLNSQSRQYYLNQAKQGPWKLDLSNDAGRIYVKFTIPVKDEQEKAMVDGRLEEQDKFRLNSVGSYVKKLLKNEGIDLEDLDFSHKMLNTPNRSGFLITIK